MMKKQCSEENDNLFNPGDDWWNNVSIQISDDKWGIYSDGYKRAAEILMEHVLQKRVEKNFLVYPVLFLYRHYIELKLKEILKDGYLYLNKKDRIPNHHNIAALWQECRKIVTEICLTESCTDGYLKELHIVGKHIQKFVKYDLDSISFRYPTCTKGALTLSKLGYVNLSKLQRVMKRIINILDSLSEGICILKDQKNEYLSIIYK